MSCHRELIPVWDQLAIDQFDLWQVVPRQVYTPYSTCVCCCQSRRLSWVTGVYLWLLKTLLGGKGFICGAQTTGIEYYLLIPRELPKLKTQNTGQLEYSHTFEWLVQNELFHILLSFFSVPLVFRKLVKMLPNARIRFQALGKGTL